MPGAAVRTGAQLTVCAPPPQNALTNRLIRVLLIAAPATFSPTAISARLCAHTAQQQRQRRGRSVLSNAAAQPLSSAALHEYGYGYRYGPY